MVTHSQLHTMYVLAGQFHFVRPISVADFCLNAGTSGRHGDDSRLQEHLELEVFKDFRIPEVLLPTKLIVIESQTSIKTVQQSPRSTKKKTLSIECHRPFTCNFCHG